MHSDLIALPRTRTALPMHCTTFDSNALPNHPFVAAAFALAFRSLIGSSTLRACIHVSMFLLLFLPLFNPTNKNMLLGSSSGRSLSKRQVRDRAFLTLDTIHSPHPYHQCHCSIPPSPPRTPLSARSTNKATYNLCCFMANALLCTAAHCCALKRQTKL